jgi:hypothetical protein
MKIAKKNISVLCTSIYNSPYFYKYFGALHPKVSKKDLRYKNRL